MSDFCMLSFSFVPAPLYGISVRKLEEIMNYKCADQHTHITSLSVADGTWGFFIHRSLWLYEQNPHSHTDFKCDSGCREMSQGSDLLVFCKLGVQCTASSIASVGVQPRRVSEILTVARSALEVALSTPCKWLLLLQWWYFWFTGS